VLRNLEDRKGKPARLVLGDPLPEEIELLPKPERLHGFRVGGTDNRSSSVNSGNGSRCVYCREAEMSGNPLLFASINGELFFAHRVCLDREWRRSWQLRFYFMNYKYLTVTA
jgi:hypothetical protein